MGVEIEMLTVKEIAAILKCGTKPIYDEIRTGRLRGVKVRKQWLIRRDALEAYLSSLSNNGVGEKSE
ncbi:MAG: helix-turn-helix domain-containing protein [Bacillota bacterium]